jgi:hypothetical protein
MAIEMDDPMRRILRRHDKNELIAMVERGMEVQRERDALRELLREAYPYLPMAISLAEELAEMFPDIARPQDIAPTETEAE